MGVEIGVIESCVIELGVIEFINKGGAPFQNRPLVDDGPLGRSLPILTEGRTRAHSHERPMILANSPPRRK